MSGKKAEIDTTKRYIPSERDWECDFKDEDNGKYFHTCDFCNNLFLAHKRRGNCCQVCLKEACEVNHE